MAGNLSDYRRRAGWAAAGVYAQCNGYRTHIFEHASQPGPAAGGGGGAAITSTAGSIF